MNHAPEEAFATPVMSLVVQSLWKEVFYLFNYGFYANLFYQISIVMLAIQIADQWKYIWVWLLVVATNIVAALIVIALNGVELWSQIRDCTIFTSIIKPWNFVTTGGPIAALVIESFLAQDIWAGLQKQRGDDLNPPLDVEISYEERVAVCVLVLAAALSLMQYLQGFPTFAPLVVMIREIVIDILPFSFLLVVIMVCFSFVFNIDRPEAANSLSSGLFQTFVVGILADFDTNDFNDTKTGAWFSKIIFVILMFAVQVVMLNLLIAIMGSTYERVSDMQYTTLRASRARVVIKQVNLLSVFRNRYRTFTDHNDLAYSLVPISAASRKTGQHAWSGHLNALKKHMDDRLREQMTNFKDELTLIQEDVAHHQTMQEDLGEIKDSLGLIMKHMKINRD